MKAQIHEYVQPGFAQTEVSSFGDVSAHEVEAAAERILKELQAEEQGETDQQSDATSSSDMKSIRAQSRDADGTMASPQ